MIRTPFTIAMSDEFDNKEFNEWIMQQRQSLGDGPITDHEYFRKLGFCKRDMDRTSSEYNVLFAMAKYELSADGGSLGSTYDNWNNRKVIMHQLLLLCGHFGTTLESVMNDLRGKGIIATLSDNKVYYSGGFFEKEDRPIRWFSIDDKVADDTVAFTSGEVLTKPCHD